VEKMISNLERSLKEEFKKTRKEGKIEGKKEGKIEGKIEGIRMVLLEQLKEKFKDIPFEYINGLEKLDDKALLALARDILKIEKLDDLKKYIN
jgi:flagellar biosynthesis/type III secretory pathway protein FliH